ncbi:MAG: hypothetical protein ACPGSB_06220 [Opitutales bacterium]
MKQLKALFKRTKEFFLDIRDDWVDMWRRGPVSFMRGLRLDFRENLDSLAVWFKELKTKPTEEQRVFEKELKANRQREFRADLRENLVRIATSPWRLVVRLWHGLLRFRELSLRESIAELWNLYLSLISNVLSQLLRNWQRLMKLPIWLRGSILVLLVIILSGVASSPWLIKELQEYRAKEMLAEAKALQAGNIETNDVEGLVEAFRMTRAAALMQPDDLEAVELALDLANNIGAPEAIWWSERLAQMKDYDVNSMDRVIETALRHRRVEKAEMSLIQMKSRFPEQDGLAEKEVELLLARNRNIEAMQRAISALDSGADSPLLHTTAVGLGLLSSAESIKDRMYEHLLEHIYRDDEVGLALARLVLTRGIGIAEDGNGFIDYDRLIQFVDNHGESTAVDRIAAYSLGLRLGIIELDVAQEKILEQFDLSDTQQLLQALEGLARLGLYETYDVILVPELLAEEPSLVLAKIASLVLREEADLDTAESILNDTYSVETAPIPAPLSTFWRGIIAERRGDPDAMNKAIVDAVQGTGRRQWGYLMGIISQVASPEQTLLFYRELFEHSGRQPEIASQYLRIAYAVAEDADIARLVRYLQLELFQNEPQALAFLIYLKLVFGESVEDTRRYAEKLFAEQPYDISFVISLANTYAQSNRHDFARRLLAFWNYEEAFQNLPPYLQLSYLMATGRKVEIDPSLLSTAREREVLEQLLSDS